jgi:beta-mannosidase
LGRRCLELDGSRPFRRSCPYGGDVHWYGVYWEGRPILDYRKAADGRLETWSPDRAPHLLGAPSAFTEFGLSSPPNLETWERIIPQDELTDWPPSSDAVFLHHTPTYSDVHVDLMTQYASKFLEPRDLRRLIQGMQLSQGMGLKFLIESMRARKPETVGTMIYKWTDNYPACAWSVIDYYGVPKRAYYDVREAYAPVHVMALFDAWSSGEDGRLKLSYFGVNDSREPVKGKCQAVWLDGALKKIREDHFDLTLANDRAIHFSTVEIDLSSRKNPVFLILSFFDHSGDLLDRNAYPFNFVEDRGCLFNCPPAILSVRRYNDVLSIQNTGTCMALSVSINPGSASNTIYPSKDNLWLFPGETIETHLISTLAVDGQDRALDQLVVRGWNVEPLEIGNTSEDLEA